MPDHVDVPKTYKLYVNGGFPRSESGRSLPVTDARGTVLTHVAHASRKDLRDAVEAARAALAGWSGRTAYNRGQILYRMAEMLEGRQEAFVDAIRATGRATAGGGGKKGPGGITPAAASKEITTSIDRLVAFAGWTDKIAQILGGQNQVDGPYYNFTAPEPTGVVAVVPPDRPALLGLVTLLAPPLCAGNTVVVIAGSEHPLPAAIFGEVCATSDVPAGVVNILTGHREELLEHIAQHRDIDAVSAANLSKDETTTLRLGAAENVKRVRVDRISPETAWLDAERMESPWAIEPFVEMKTIWHPSSAK